MRLLLEIKSGPYAGKRIEAETGQVVSVGRAPKADVVLEDNFLSGKHFVIECDRRVCRVRDLNSRNGTRLNGQPVVTGVLKNGDLIGAGHTDFVVRIEEVSKVISSPKDQPQAAAPPPSTKSSQRRPRTPSQARRREAVAPAPVTQPEPQPQAEQLSHSPATSQAKTPESPPVFPAIESAPAPAISILPATLGSYEAVTPAGKLFDIFSSQPGGLMALVDATQDAKVLHLLRGANEEYQSLYRTEQNPTIAPYLVRLPPRCALLKQMIEQGWGHEWGVYLTCPLSLSELRNYLRTSLMVTMPDGMELFSRFYDPNFFRGFLESCTAPEADKFFGPITSYFMEDERPEILLEFKRGKKGAEKKGHLLSVLP